MASKGWLSIGLILALSLLTACSQPQPVIVPVIAQDAAVSVPEPAPMRLEPFEWKIDASGDYALSEDGYKALQIDLIEVTRYIGEQSAIIDMLKSIMESRSSKH